MSESYGKLTKQLHFETLKKDLENGQSVFVTSFTKMPVNNLSDLRKRLREKKATYRVVKNALIQKVLESDATRRSLGTKITGQCGICVAQGEISAASKLLLDFAGENETFQVNGVFFEGTVYDAAQVKAFASLPSRHELIAKVCGGLQAPIVGFVGGLSGITRNFVSVLDQIGKKKSSQ